MRDDAAHHHAERQTQRGAQECIAILDPEVLLAGELSDDDIHADDGGAKHTCYAAQQGHDPSSLIVGESGG